jgi:hypothetical protein
MRIGFTIILNGLHHLKHRNYAEYLLKNCLDYWVIVDGASLSNGSTSWCNNMPENNHNNGASIDGTIVYLKELENRYDNLKVVYSENMYASKDSQVNVAVEEIKKKYNSGFLWEIDVDEQWDVEDMLLSEKELIEKNGKCGNFSCNLYIGKNLIVRGDWGEHNYYRLWKWEGEMFKSHEPPILENNDPVVKMNQRFNHYSYYFEKDVKFKSIWYGNHQDVYDNWIILNSKPKESFPMHIGNLMKQCSIYAAEIIWVD